MLIKPALKFKHGMVVQPACDRAFVLEDELAGEKLRLRKFVGDDIAQLRRLVHDVRAERDVRLGVKTALAHVGDVAFDLGARMFAQIFHLGRALEVAGVEHADLHEDKILINFWEHPHDGEQRMQAEAVEAVDEKHGGARVQIARRRRFFHDNGVVGQRGGDEFIEPVQFFLRVAVMAFDPEREADQHAGDEQRRPAAFKEFHDAK